ncbi:MAG TPA: hypothetical protein VIG76_05335 [Amnibacterium sp.]|jgi:hypothetical protein|uniref:hypothetical protein n=1 Tax=Amnibacterium sp. TaxID=1872496 RepID=UPI002F93D797
MAAAPGTWHLPDGRWGRFLRSLLDGRLAYFSLFVIVHAVLACTTAGMTGLDFVELALICAPQGVLALHRTMSTATLTVSSAALVLAAALGITALPTDGSPPGYEAWQLGAITISLLGFALIRRYLAAWLSLLAIATIAVCWSVFTGQGWVPGVALVDRHVGTLLVGTVFAWSLARATATFTAYQALERRTRAQERAASARAGARRAAAEAVLEQAGPMLHAIAEGHPLTDADRRELLVIEGALRDQIRAPNLAKPPLLEAIADARRRGVNVLLLDEVDGPAHPRMHEQAAVWLAERVAASHGERFVGRVRSADGGLAVSAVTGSVSDSTTIPALATRSTVPAGAGDVGVPS